MGGAANGLDKVIVVEIANELIKETVRGKYVPK
jgi:hypothetical protein